MLMRNVSKIGVVVVAAHVMVSEAFGIGLGSRSLFTAPTPTFPSVPSAPVIQPLGPIAPTPLLTDSAASQIQNANDVAALAFSGQGHRGWQSSAAKVHSRVTEEFAFQQERLPGSVLGEWPNVRWNSPFIAYDSNGQMVLDLAHPMLPENRFPGVMDARVSPKIFVPNDYSWGSLSPRPTDPVIAPAPTAVQIPSAPIAPAAVFAMPTSI